MGLRTASARRPLAATAMAPALTETSQPQGFEHPINGKPACNAFDNLNTLALATELIKADVPMADHHPQDPVEFLTDDIMQVIKSMEGSAAAELLFNDVEIEEPADAKEAEDKTKELLATVTTTQLRLERRLAFLMRRTRKFQARGLSQHISQEIAGVFELGHGAMRKKKVDSGRLIYKKTEERPCTPPAIRVEGDHGKSSESTTPALIPFPTGHPLFIGPAAAQPNNLVRDPLRLCENDDHLYSQLKPSTNNNTLTIRQRDAPCRKSPIPVPNLVSLTNQKGADAAKTATDVKVAVDAVRRNESTNPGEVNFTEADCPNSKHTKENLEHKHNSKHDPNSVNVVNKNVNNLGDKSNELEKLITDKLNSHVGDTAKKNNNFVKLQDIVIKPNLNYNPKIQETGGKDETATAGDYCKPVTTILHDHLSRPLQASEDMKRPIALASVRSMCKKFGLATAMQGNNAFRHRHTTSGKYFGSGSAVVGTQPRTGSAITLDHFPVESKREMQRVTGHLISEVKMVQDGLDSEATASSSGGESCDEMQPYTNPHQQYLPIYKRAAWKYATDRAAIAARWTWLQAQVSDLEYKIRQYSELHRRIRAGKDRIRMGGASPPRNPSVSPTPTAVNGYRGQLPGAPNSKPCDAASEAQCSRTRPLLHFRKRKLVSLNGLHFVSKKAARPASIRCTCSTPEEECALCTGRLDPLNPRDVCDYLSTNEMLGLLDSSYHPIFSMADDASSSLHMEAVMKTEDWQTRSSARTQQKAIRFPKMERPEKLVAGDHRPSRKSEHRKKNNRLRQSTANALTAKIKNRYRGKKHARPSSSLDGADEEVESLGIGTNSMSKFDSPSSSPLLSTQPFSGFTKRSRADSYDIDNIIIPYSVAASTRVEKLQYKEILTPKWRIAENEFHTKYDLRNNGIVKASQEIIAEDEEDITEDAVTQRHEKCEQDEKKKFLSYLKLPIGYGRSRSSRRTDSRAESSGANTPDPMSPAPACHGAPDPPSDSPLTTPPATPGPGAAPEETATRRRTSSHSKQSGGGGVAATTTSPADREPGCPLAEVPEVPPYDKRTFPIPDETYDRMLKSMPEHHRVTTNAASQDSFSAAGGSPPTASSEPEHDSESTESAFGDEDPNDPEWDLERVKDKYRR